MACSGLTDDDLPMSGLHGHYHTVIFVDNEFSTIPYDALPGVHAQVLEIINNHNLTTIESGFFTETASPTHTIFMTSNPSLEDFPFEDLENFHSLSTFTLIGSNVTEIPSNSTWSPSIHTISLMGNENLQLIEPFAFSSAHGIRNLEIFGSENLTISSNGLHSTSHHAKTLRIDMPSYFESNAFGTFQDSELWTTIDIVTEDFPEDVFRHVLKSHFENHNSDVFQQSFGDAKVANCNSCDIAWLYQDAQNFGLDQYRNIVGENNVLCPEIGPVLTTEDQDFIQLMESCPGKKIDLLRNFFSKPNFRD